MERFDPGTGAGKHDTGRSFERCGDERGAASVRARLSPLGQAETGWAMVPTDRTTWMLNLQKIILKVYLE